MACHNCGFENPKEARFCGNCGSALMVACADCGHPNPTALNYCTSCGTALKPEREPLAAAPAIATAAPDPAGPAPATTSWPVIKEIGPERRHLTVLFCDLVGSTELAQALDPEDLRVVMGAYETACSEVVERLGGYVAQYYGDGVLAYFGYPVAHEDAAERAVRAGLELVGAVAQVPAQQPLRVRVGIHSGLVVVGMERSGVPGKSNSAVGETPNLAARLQALAEPGQVLISTATHALVEDVFETVDTGVHTLKGISEPVRVHHVLGEERGRHRYEAAPGALTPLIGRDRELAAMLDRWALAREGHGQVVLIGGEAGIGKSRLVEELRERLRAEPVMLMRHHCSPYHQTSPLYPIAQAIEWALEFGPDESVVARLERIRGWVRGNGLDEADSCALIATLLKIPPCDDCPAPALGPTQVKEGMLTTLLSVISHAASRQPVLFVLENAQWADPSTLDFLGLVVDQVATLRVLVVVTYRTEFQPPWPARAHVLPLMLTRLAGGKTRALVEQVAGARALPDEVLDKIVGRADGVPMFVEELTETMLASGYLVEREGRFELTGPLPPVAVPASLQDSLMARLDRLGPHKEVAQIAAMLGRTFRYDVLAAVVPLNEKALHVALDLLVRQELLLRRGLPPEAVYVFRQALIQEVAYQSLLKSQRQKFHLRIAEALEAGFPGIVEAEPEEIARHYAAAGVDDRAFDYCRRAAERAVRASAMAEALVHLDAALELLARLPDGESARRNESELLVLRGNALGATRGHATTEVGQAYERALALSEASGDTEVEVRALVGVYAHNVSLGRIDKAREIGSRLLDLAEKVSDADVLLAANLIRGVSLGDDGEVVAASRHLERAIDILGTAEPGEALWMTAQDPGVVAWSLLGRNRFVLGRPDQAREAIRRARERSEQVRHPLSHDFALALAGSVLATMRDWPASERVSAEAATLADEHGFPTWQAHTAIYHGLARMKLGHRGEGEAEVERGLALGEKVWVTGPSIFFLVALAEVALEIGRAGDALAHVERALELLDSRGGRSYEAELHRLRGTALRRQGRDREAGEALRRAIEIARRQQALSWELRAAIELAEMQLAAGDDDTAHALLRPIYDRFSEGFDTPDLERARALLEPVPA